MKTFPMISFKELSPGNILLDKNRNEPCFVSDLDKGTEIIGVKPIIKNLPFSYYNISLLGAESTIQLSELEPIPISESWLSSLNFEKDITQKNVWVSYNRKHQAVHILFPKDQLEQTIGIVSPSNKEVKYVHEVQNCIINSEGDILDDIE